jgi:hypothetical protein
MADVILPHAAHQLGLGDLHLDTDALAVMLVMTNFDLPTDLHATSLSAMTLDECDGANYTRLTPANVTYVKDAPNARSELGFDPAVWSSLGQGTRQVKALLLIRDTGTDTTSYVIGYYDTGGFPFDPTGSDNTYTPNAEGAVQITT